jgi:CRP-like cAMP-binding protein
MMRPKKAICTLIDTLLPHAELLVSPETYAFTEGQVIHNDKAYSKIYLLEAGFVNVRRELDDLVIATAFAPELVGLAHYPGMDAHFYLELGPHCRMWSVSRTTAVNQIKKHELYREWMQILSFKMAFMYERDRAIQQRNAQDVVFSMLKRFALIPKEFRDYITVSKFIEQRTTLSKSSIQRALTHFRDQGIITLQDGFLLTTTLPNTHKISITE